MNSISAVIAFIDYLESGLESFRENVSVINE